MVEEEVVVVVLVEVVVVDVVLVSVVVVVVVVDVVVVLVSVVVVVVVISSTAFPQAPSQNHIRITSSTELIRTNFLFSINQYYTIFILSQTSILCYNKNYAKAHHCRKLEDA